jgi:hypothetical protein
MGIAPRSYKTLAIRSTADQPFLSICSIPRVRGGKPFATIGEPPRILTARRAGGVQRQTFADELGQVARVGEAERDEMSRSPAGT